jgi:hypothetical protein
MQAMPNVARVCCLVCGKQQLQPLISLSEEGTPPKSPGHTFTYSYDVIVSCNHCHHGQLETYAHDCFHYYENEDWDMYWWYGIVPSDVIRLRSVFKTCDDWLNARCGCAVHRSLRESMKHSWSGVLHAIFPRENASFAWLSLEEEQEKVVFKLDRQKGIGKSVC